MALKTLADEARKFSTPAGKAEKLAQQISDEVDAMSDAEVLEKRAEMDRIRKAYAEKEAEEQEEALGETIGKGLTAYLKKHAIDLDGISTFVKSAQEHGVPPEKLGESVAKAAEWVDAMDKAAEKLAAEKTAA